MVPGVEVVVGVMLVIGVVAVFGVDEGIFKVVIIAGSKNILILDSVLIASKLYVNRNTHIVVTHITRAYYTRILTMVTVFYTPSVMCTTVQI